MALSAYEQLMRLVLGSKNMLKTTARFLVNFSNPVISGAGLVSRSLPCSSSILFIAGGDFNSSCFGFETQLQQVRHRNIRRPIVGPPRPPRFGKMTPEANKYAYDPIFPKDGRYTTRPIPIQRLGGRDKKTGRVVVRTIGGGNKKLFRWVDWKRHAPEGETIEEKVYNIRYDPLNTPLLALVASGGHKRWIIASENMKPGDIIKTTNIIPRNPARVKEAEAWPIGAIPPGTLVHCLEERVGEGAKWARVAGSSCEIVRRLNKMIVVKLPNRREVALDERCMATIGKVSNTEHNTVNLLVPQRMRWKGKRQHSGLWHRKDGYCGRKVRPPKPMQIIASDQKIQEKKYFLQPVHLLTN